MSDYKSVEDKFLLVQRPSDAGEIRKYWIVYNSELVYEFGCTYHDEANEVLAAFIGGSNWQKESSE